MNDGLMGSKTKELYNALFWLLFAIYVAFESYRIGLGKWSMPGPGYFPFGAALAIGIISIFLLVKALRQAPFNEELISLPKGRLDHVVLSLLAMVMYVVLLKSIGFLLCTFFLVMFFLRVVAMKRWVTALIVALSLSFGFYLFLTSCWMPNFPTAS